MACILLPCVPEPPDYRDFSPAQKFQTFLFHDDLEHLFRLVTFDLVLREERTGQYRIPFPDQSQFLLFCRLF